LAGAWRFVGQFSSIGSGLRVGTIHDYFEKDMNGVLFQSVGS
jgi:hypothetical protein